jgi:hypothetical protein
MVAISLGSFSRPYKQLGEHSVSDGVDLILLPSADYTIHGIRR